MLPTKRHSRLTPATRRTRRHVYRQASWRSFELRPYTARCCPWSSQAAGLFITSYYDYVAADGTPVQNILVFSVTPIKVKVGDFGPIKTSLGLVGSETVWAHSILRDPP